MGFTIAMPMIARADRKLETNLTAFWREFDSSFQLRWGFISENNL
jgi:hypothetical protein